MKTTLELIMLIKMFLKVHMLFLIKFYFLLSNYTKYLSMVYNITNLPTALDKFETKHLSLYFSKIIEYLFISKNGTTMLGKK
jgi:hypothetical protein